MAKRISIINFKGGVGKTTLAFHLATGLARYHNARVLLIDMDHQSSISVVCLDAQTWISVARKNRTVTQIFRAFVEKEIQFPGDEIVIHHPMDGRRQYSDFSSHYKNISLVPASLELDDIEIQLTATYHGHVHSEWEKRTLICRWIEETGVNDQFDYIIFDCPPATKIAAQNAIAASHGYIIPVVPEAVMERGAAHLRDMLESGIDARLKEYAANGDPARIMHVPDTKLIGVVVTRIQVASSESGYTNEHTMHLEFIKKEWGNRLLEPYIMQGTGVSSALSSGIPVYDSQQRQNIQERGIDEQFKQLTDNLKRRIDQL